MKVLIVLCLMFVVMGCGKEEEEEADTSTLFSGEGQVSSWTQYNGQTASLLADMTLTAADFEGLENTYIGTAAFIENNFSDERESYFEANSTGSTLIEEISGRDFIRTSYLADYEKRDEVSDCIDDLIAESILTTEGSEYRIDIDIVLTPCLKDDLRETLSEYSGSLKASFYGQCDDTNLKSFDGMTYAEMETEQKYYGGAFCPQQTSSAMAVIYKEAYTSTYTYTSAEDGTTTTTVVKRDQTDRVAQYDENGLSCQKKRKGDEIFFEDGCVDYITTETYYDDSATPSVEFYTQTTRDLVQEIGDHEWYKSGTMDVFYRGWNGVVTFNGSDEVPTWAFSKDGEEVSGDFSISAE